MNNTDNAARTGQVAQHTPTPYKMSPIYARLIEGRGGEPVAALSGPWDCAAANAAFIVRACNSHAAFEALATELAAWTGPSYSASRALRGFQEAARAALALAKGGQQ